MKMGRVDDPLSEASIGFFVDGNHVWGIPSPVRRGYDAAFDPVTDDPEAHAIFFTNLTNIQGPWRRLGRWYAMFVAQPFDSAERDRLAGRRALLAVFSQQGDDFIVMMVHRQLSKASDECLGILRGNDPDKLDQWLDNAQSSGFSSIGRFARVLHRDVDAVKNAITEKWSNGQAEGQINRLKTLKRAMYGRAGVELLRARMAPPLIIHVHGK